MNALEVLNRSLFLQLNAGVQTGAGVISTATFIADVLIYLIPLALVVVWLWQPERRQLALRACLVCCIALGIGQLLALFWPHPRPFMIGLGHTWIPHAADASFPSEHGIVFASMACSLLLTGELALGVLTAIMGIAVAWSRIFLGVHFPLDMLGALGVSLLAYLLLSPVWTRWASPFMQAAEKLYRYLLARPIAKGWIRA
ncbi:phosphatase PAP2 family protein [Undibacterium sp. Ji42W]|uniref:phosphatase PAP2 family protein n=1 Tax=Undibacterium sp. Ji42W TaxID=3413039 RepID=UPI003BF1E8C2